MKPLCAKRKCTYDFNALDHCNALVAGLDDLRHRGLLVDVTLIVQRQRFSAHRIVLASCCDFFRAMFTDGMMEEAEREIVLNDLTATGISNILDYIYTSKLTLTLGNTQDVLSAASHLQITPIMEVCSKFLNTQLDLDNCLDILTLAELYSLQDLEHFAYRFVGENLHCLGCLPQFNRLTWRQLWRFLVQDYPASVPEVEVLECALNWIGSNFEERSCVLDTVLDLIHSECISRNEVRNTRICPQLDSFWNHISTADSYLRKSLHEFESLCQKSNKKDHDLSLVNSRGFKKAIITVGGFQYLKGLSNDLEYCHPEVDGTWKKLTSIPHIDQSDFGVAILDGDLYVVGGCFNQALQVNVHPYGFRYNPRADSWTSIAAMQQDRCRFYLGAVAGKLYAIGGCCDDQVIGLQLVDSCESYDPVDDAWRQTAGIPTSCSQHAGATIDNNIYTAGGLDCDDRVLNTVYCYDTTTDIWISRSPMPVARVDHCMVSHAGRLFVVGGWWSNDIADGGRNTVDSVDSYDPATDQWSNLTVLPTPRYHSSSAVLDGRLYIIGGLDDTPDVIRSSKKIEVLDLVDVKWLVHEDFPEEIREHMSCVLYVPTCRSDTDWNSEDTSPRNSSDQDRTKKSFTVAIHD